MLQILIQTIFSIFVWCYLLRTVSKIVKQRYLLSCYTLICVLSLSPYILSWNSVILAESYSISFIVLIFSLIIRIMCYPSIAHKLSLIFSTYLWLSIHNRNLLAGVLLLVFLTLLFIKKIYSLVLKNKLLTFLIGILMIHLVIIGNNQKDENYGDNISYSQVLPFYVFSNHPSASEIQKRLLQVPEMECMSAGNFDDLNLLVQFTARNCPESLMWIDTNFVLWYLKFLVTNPNITLTMINAGVIAANSPSTLYAGSLSVVPKSVTAIYFGERNFFLGLQDNITQVVPVDTIRLTSPIYLWMFIFMCIIFISFKNFSLRNSSSQLFLILFLLIGSWALIWILIMPIVIPSEFFRLSIQFYTILILSCIVIIFTEIGQIKIDQKA